MRRSGCPLPGVHRMSSASSRSPSSGCRGTCCTIIVDWAARLPLTFRSPEPYLTGPMGATLSYQVATNGSSEVIGRFDLKGAAIDARPLGWKKEPGNDAQLASTLKFATGGKLATVDFEGRGDGLLGK